MPDVIKVSDVFVPGKVPALTYNPRVELQLEQHLQDFLEEGGAILTVAGPTKTGKSVLLRRVIDRPIWVEGQSVADSDTLWALIADELQLFTQHEIGTETSGVGTGEIGAEAGFGPIAKVSSKAAYSAHDTDSRRQAVDRPLVAVVKGAISGAKRPIVIDDFHFIKQEAQRDIVRALKPLALAGVPIIFVSISHRVQDVVSAEPDMTGRVVPLQVSFWTDHELKYIAESGFRAMNVQDESGALAKKLAGEAYGSPHLMQKFCRELCKRNDVRRRQETLKTLQAPSDWAEFFTAQADAASRDWFERLLSGPQERGNKRTQWQIKEDGTLDGYGLTLLAISKTGPKLTLTKDEIKAAVAKEVDGVGPAAQQTTRVLQRFSSIARKRMTEPTPSEEEIDAMVDTATESVPDVQPVLEYMEDDPNSKLHIADPFFAFFLRWGSQPYLVHPTVI